MSSSNSTLVIVSLGIGIVVIMGVGGLVAYSNVNNQLVSSQAQLQQVQKERDDLKKQSEDKDKEIKDLHGTISGGKEEISRKLEEIQQAKTETQTVSGCLKGVVEALSYTDDQAKAIFALGAVKDKCASAERIVKRIEDTRDEQPRSPRTNNISN
ncbi:MULTISPECIES: hypothetical protein [unclassified Microcoleus]|uniref:hypothetical protein n=1 Tax=unclassified Microcoleus TaxID=2642155 RepID=UPI002FD4E5DC